ncbi:MAG: hypothetical protein Q4D62_16340 [Planctomycetia bacterium]|nr:hypothetical protein [Planctomycetia bacterium]
MKTLVEKVCPTCGKMFIGGGNLKKFCSDECRIFRGRTLKRKICHRCGSLFITRKDTQVYCSALCQIQASNQRRRRRKPSRKRRKKKTDATITTEKKTMKELEAERQKTPQDAVFVRAGGRYFGFWLRPEEAERLDAVIQRRNQLNDMETRTSPPICEPTQ